ncbi:hypothetical protein Pmani_000659 [Petrolisthes manimaculis]|uniref:Uncharacterized protein n=1 Tax=Petrolisthes manimaculis TaxID=1843537 RepID=A0AAE1UM51_9EUCA|nr:hypothetical protein Pmani_000659 [Petrolisthes manimaculis]
MEFFTSSADLRSQVAPTDYCKMAVLDGLAESRMLTSQYGRPPFSPHLLGCLEFSPALSAAFPLTPQVSSWPL